MTQISSTSNSDINVNVDKCAAVLVPNPNQEQCRGCLIVFEGLDRSGKSTQCELLAKALRDSGKRVQLMKFPNRSSPTTGALIDSYLKSGIELDDHAVHLLFSANRWEMMKSMQDLLKQGVHIICDRYVHSGVAYSCAKGLDREWCMNPDRGLLKPDLLLFMKLPNVGTAVQTRSGFGDERYEQVQFQQRVGQEFDHLLHDYQGSMFQLDATGSIEDIHAAILKHVHYTIDTVSRGGVDSHKFD